MIFRDFADPDQSPYFSPDHLPFCVQSPCPTPAAIFMQGYAEGGKDITLCREHALQLGRKLLEDACALGPYGRHG